MRHYSIPKHSANSQTHRYLAAPSLISYQGLLFISRLLCRLYLLIRISNRYQIVIFLNRRKALTLHWRPGLQLLVMIALPSISIHLILHSIMSHSWIKYYRPVRLCIFLVGLKGSMLSISLRVIRQIFRWGLCLLLKTSIFLMCNLLIRNSNSQQQTKYTPQAGTTTNPPWPATLPSWSP